MRSKGTPNMTKDLSWCVSQCLKMVFHIHKQKFERVAMMVMRDTSSRDAPEPFNASGVRVVGRSVDKVQMFSQFSKHVAHEQGASRCVGLRLSAITMATRPRCLERIAALRTCSQNMSAVRPVATRPSNQPSRQSTKPKPYTFRLSPGASTRRCPRRPFRDQTRVRVG